MSALLRSDDGPVLLFPWHIGAGHLGRLIEIGKIIARTSGRDVRVCREGITVPLIAATFNADRQRLSGAASYVTVTGLDAAWSQSGLYNAERVRGQVERDLAVIRELRPSLVVTHMQPTAVLAARAAQVPVMSVADGDFLDPDPWSWMPWARDRGLRIPPYPPSRPAFNQVADELGLSSMRDDVDLMWGDRTIVPSAPSVDPVPSAPDGVHEPIFCGPLIWSDGPPLDVREPRSRSVYLGLGSGQLWPEGIDPTMQEVADRLDATVFRSSPNGHEDDTDRLRHVEFGTVSQLVAATHVTVTHGGHSTVHAALAAGRPVLVAPFMSENENNGRLFVETRGAGFCLWHTDVDGGRLVYRDGSGAVHDQAPLTADVLAPALRKLLDDQDRRNGAAGVARDLGVAAEGQADLIALAVDACVGATGGDRRP